MPIENASDPRTRMLREKYFSLRPKPLERWLWQQGVPAAAERVFWLHWEEGMKSGDWCSQLSLRQVATLCCVDPSTVTRAYQMLRERGLINRQDPGRDPDNPFQQATAITEVRLPRALLAQLSASPNRFNINKLHVSQESQRRRAVEPLSHSGTETERLTRQEIQATWHRASSAERGRYFHASRSGLAQMEFDQDSQLTEKDRVQLQDQLKQMAGARTCTSDAVEYVRLSSIDERRRPPASRRLSALMLARARARLLQVASPSAVGELWREIVWSVEEGALRRFDAALALNIAVKKIRDGVWTRPNRMPPNWARQLAHPETCVAA
jgi:hypothetical protein